MTPWTAAHQASLSLTVSRSFSRLVSVESVMLSNHLILCRPQKVCKLYLKVGFLKHDAPPKQERCVRADSKVWVRGGVEAPDFHCFHSLVIQMSSHSVSILRSSSLLTNFPISLFLSA